VSTHIFAQIIAVLFECESVLASLVSLTLDMYEASPLFVAHFSRVIALAAFVLASLATVCRRSSSFCR
jgi:hypothetical protein